MNHVRGHYDLALNCQRCSNNGRFQGLTDYGTREQARKKGWVVQWKRDIAICPVCAAIKPPQSKPRQSHKDRTWQMRVQGIPRKLERTRMVLSGKTLRETAEAFGVSESMIRQNLNYMLALAAKRYRIPTGLPPLKEVRENADGWNAAMDMIELDYFGEEGRATGSENRRITRP